MTITKPLIAIGFAAILTAAASPTHAGGILEDYCLAQGEPAAKCTCGQEVADETLSTPDQERFVAISADPSAFFQLLSGTAEDQAFLGRVEAFSEATESRCGP